MPFTMDQQLQSDLSATGSLQQLLRPPVHSDRLLLLRVEIDRLSRHRLLRFTQEKQTNQFSSRFPSLRHAHRLLPRLPVHARWSDCCHASIQHSGA